MRWQLNQILSDYSAYQIWKARTLNCKKAIFSNVKKIQKFQVYKLHNHLYQSCLILNVESAGTFLRQNLRIPVWSFKRFGNSGADRFHYKVPGRLWPIKSLPSFISSKINESWFLINWYPISPTSSYYYTIKAFSYQRHEVFFLMSCTSFQDPQLYFSSPSCSTLSSFVHPSRHNLFPLVALFQLVAWFIAAEWVSLTGEDETTPVK